MRHGDLHRFVLAALATVAGACTAGRPPGGGGLSAPAPPPVVPPPPAVALEREPSAASPDVLTLDAAVALVRAHNPELATAAWNVEASAARIVQADKLPNPQAGITVEDVGASGDRAGGEQAETTVRLAQRLEIGGQRGARVEAAARGRDLTAWDYVGLRLDLEAEAARAFYDVLGAQEQLVLSDQAVRLGEQVVGSVARLVDAGREPSAELTRAEVALAGARIDRAQVRRGLDSARRRLAALWGASNPTFVRVEAVPAAAGSPPPPAVLERQLPRNPDLARWATEQAEREAAVVLEERRAIPDVTVEAGYRRFEDTDDSGFVFGAFVPLPVLDRNQGAIAEARHRLAAAREAQRTAEVRTRTALGQAYGELTTAYAEVAALRDSILPAATRAFEGVNAGYNEGRYRYLDVLDAQRILVATRERLVRALTDYRQALVRVERLVGGPVDHASNSAAIGAPTP